MDKWGVIIDTKLDELDSYLVLSYSYGAYEIECLCDDGIPWNAERETAIAMLKDFGIEMRKRKEDLKEGDRKEDMTLEELNKRLAVAYREKEAALEIILERADAVSVLSVIMDGTIKNIKCEWADTADELIAHVVLEMDNGESESCRIAIFAPDTQPSCWKEFCTATGLPFVQTNLSEAYNDEIISEIIGKRVAVRYGCGGYLLPAAEAIGFAPLRKRKGGLKKGDEDDSENVKRAEQHIKELLARKRVAWDCADMAGWMETLLYNSKDCGEFGQLVRFEVAANILHDAILQ